MFETIRNKNYDFTKEKYSTHFPNFHNYPATMLPQIGIEIFKELKIKKGAMLDPYCGTGSSMVAGLVSGLSEFYGNDINPLAILIAKSKYSNFSEKKLIRYKNNILEAIYERHDQLDFPKITNLEFWYSKRVARDLATIRSVIFDEVKEEKYRCIFLVPFSRVSRETSYTRNSEFKLYRMNEEKIKKFKPDVFEQYEKYLNKVLEAYLVHYKPLLKKRKFNFINDSFSSGKKFYDVVLTSPPYGDSRTTVAYGQFSTLSNEWLGIKNARKIDRMLMGGIKSDTIYDKGVIKKYLKKIEKEDVRRSLEVSAFYIDLQHSISNISKNIKSKGYSIYIVGNRTVKSVKLPTDKFIAEQFCNNGFDHLFTYERNISSKAMPSKNSPTNVAGKSKATMHKEYIVVCQNK